MRNLWGQTYNFYEIFIIYSVRMYQGEAVGGNYDAYNLNWKCQNKLPVRYHSMGQI
jgi:hypothetical protein